MPTLTASSTIAVISCGVETKTSTPQFSLNIHSFFGWFTRAITRGIPNSCLASSETTRLSSSSPVAATITSQASRWASFSVATSQASPMCHSIPAWVAARAATPRSCSMISTSWPDRLSASATWSPTLPAPAIATRMARKPIARPGRGGPGARHARVPD